MHTTQLVRNQKNVYGPRSYTEHGTKYRITATVRYDDQCGNGHNSFAITGSIDRFSSGHWLDDAGGCIHEEIAKHFPELAPFIKWHFMNSDGPMHYIANTVYHVLEHGPRYAWVYYVGNPDPLGIEDTKKRLLGYVTADKAQAAEGTLGYTVKWDDKTAKVRNLDGARSSAIWPDATDEELIAPGLKERLEARLPALIEAFKADLTILGLTY